MNNLEVDHSIREAWNLASLHPCRGSFAITESGGGCSPLSEKAVAWCFLGAYFKVTGNFSMPFAPLLVKRLNFPLRELMYLWDNSPLYLKEILIKKGVLEKENA